MGRHVLDAVLDSVRHPFTEKTRETHAVPQQIEAVHVGPVRSEDPEALMASWGLTIIDKISIMDYKVSCIEQLSECTPNCKYLSIILQ